MKKDEQNRNFFGEEFISPPISIADQVYAYLKEKILLGEIKPGERLKQVPVAQLVKISRTPVRDALRRLEQEGLVERVPQRGVRVTAIKEETVKEVFGVRTVLEAYALQLACAKISAEEIASLKNLQHQAQDILEDKEIRPQVKIKKLFALNSQFHELIYRSTGNTYLLEILNNLRNIVERMRYIGLRAEETWIHVWQEHGQLINYLEKRDKKAAVNLIKRHLIHAATYVLSSLKKNK